MLHTSPCDSSSSNSAKKSMLHQMRLLSVELCVTRLKVFTTHACGPAAFTSPAILDRFSSNSKWRGIVKKVDTARQLGKRGESLRTRSIQICGHAQDRLHWNDKICLQNNRSCALHVSLPIKNWKSQHRISATIYYTYLQGGKHNH